MQNHIFQSGLTQLQEIGGSYKSYAYNLLAARYVSRVVSLGSACGERGNTLFKPDYLLAVLSSTPLILTTEIMKRKQFDKKETEVTIKQYVITKLCLLCTTQRVSFRK